jgi:carbonic anhydrase
MTPSSRTLRPLETARLALLASLLAAALLARARAEDAPAATTMPVATPTATPAPASAPVRTNLGANRKEIEATIRDAMGAGDPTKKRLNLIIDKQSTAAGIAPEPATATPVNPGAAPAPAVAAPRPREPGLVIRTRPAAPPVHHEVHWSYDGEGGPANWSKLKPEYATCANGKRQSPIAIEDGDTLKGPAEPIQFRYEPSKGTVTNNGHTIQVNVYGDNSLTVRGTTYQLLQFHFHHPAEERVNGQGYPMVGHFVHRNELGQLAVVAVLLESGEANKLIENVWTYMPLDVNDSVRMPPDLINVNDILPRDQRYYQFMGSLTTPPCTEGVLWLVLKQPVSISRAQLRLFSQLYANNARPVQPGNGRAIRDAAQLQGAPAAP